MTTETLNGSTEWKGTFWRCEETSKELTVSNFFFQTIKLEMKYEEVTCFPFLFQSFLPFIAGIETNVFLKKSR